FGGENFRLWQRPVSTVKAQVERPHAQGAGTLSRAHGRDWQTRAGSEPRRWLTLPQILWCAPSDTPQPAPAHSSEPNGAARSSTPCPMTSPGRACGPDGVQLAERLHGPCTQEVQVPVYVEPQHFPRTGTRESSHAPARVHRQVRLRLNTVACLRNSL